MMEIEHCRRWLESHGHMPGEVCTACGHGYMRGACLFLHEDGKRKEPRSEPMPKVDPYGGSRDSRHAALEPADPKEAQNDGNPVKEAAQRPDPLGLHGKGSRVTPVGPCVAFTQTATGVKWTIIGDRKQFDPATLDSAMRGALAELTK